jgi:hypothetical protein
MDVNLTTLGQLIESCWNCAETETAKGVAQKHPTPTEEEITFLFSGELRMAIAAASAAGEVVRAFLRDLRNSIPNLDFGITQRVGGLIARVNLHGRWHEGKVSGADLGIVIMRPVVWIAGAGTKIEFRRNRGTGLLAQAKLGRRLDPDGAHKWGTLTKPQQRLLPKRRDYYSLLLYRLDGEKELKPFGWQLCKAHTVRQAEQWLQSNAFPEEISSSEVLGKLFAGTIGTQDSKLIETIIDPNASDARSIEIDIFWPDGAGPPPSYPLSETHGEKQRMQQRIRH